MERCNSDREVKAVLHPPLPATYNTNPKSSLLATPKKIDFTLCDAQTFESRKDARADIKQPTGESCCLASDVNPFLLALLRSKQPAPIAGIGAAEQGVRTRGAVTSASEALCAAPTKTMMGARSEGAATTCGEMMDCTL